MCLRCNKKGHTAKYCNKPRKLETKEVNVINKNAQAAKYIKIIKLNDFEYTALTGTVSSVFTTPVLMGNFEIKKNAGVLKDLGNKMTNASKSCGTSEATIHVVGVLAQKCYS